MRKKFILILSLIAIAVMLSDCSNDKNTEYSTTEESIQDVLFDDKMYGQSNKCLFNFF